MLAETREIRSWLYWGVWETPRVWRLMVTAVLLLFVGFVFNLIVINPKLPGNPGTNTIDRVDDRRFGQDYSTSETIAMAGSDCCLALGTIERGLTVLNKDSRIPREGITQGPVLDVTTGPGRDDFLVLHDDQAITHVATSHSGRPTVTSWLPRPEYPVWKTTAQSTQMEIVANQLDHHGWQIAVVGQGIARYRFSELPDGSTHRTRSWQTGSLSESPLERALMTEKGTWITLQGGSIRFAARETLDELPGRSVKTPPIRRFDAGYDGQWASASDSHNGLWIYPQDDKGWLGPFFGEEQTRCTLRSSVDVTTVRVYDPFTWFGSRYGLFAYDSDARRLSCVIPDIEVIDIALPEMSVSSAPVRHVLVASNKGLMLVSSGEPGSSERFRVNRLDSDPITLMSINPDASLGVYQARSTTQGQSAEYEIRTLKQPFAGGTPTVLIPRQGWKPLGRMPTIVGVEPVGQRLLFGTSEGAFFYDPERHSYEDRSTSLFIKETEGKRTQEEVGLKTFSSLQKGERGCLAIVDGNPQLLQECSGEEPKRWISLDPSRRTTPREIVESGGRIFGLGEAGKLHVYRYPKSLIPEDYLVGRATSLDTNPLPDNVAKGDLLLGASGRWKVAFLNNEWVVTYDSASGKIAERRLPLQGGDIQTIVQLRLVDDQLLYLLNTGKVLTEDGSEKFSSGGLPFAPERVTAIAPGLEGDTVLLGGPAGQVMRYSWSFGLWTKIGPEPITGPGAVEDVVEIQDTKNGTLARVVDNRLFHTYGESWVELKGYNRWSTDSAGAKIWVLGEDGVARLSPRKGKSVSEWVESPFSREIHGGVGMEKFVHNSSFVWQVDENTVAFFQHGSKRLGIYNVRTDTWEEKNVDSLNAPRQFIATTKYLIAVDGHKVVRIDKNWKAQTLTTLPLSVKVERVHLHTQGESLQVTFIHDNSVVLRFWKNLEGNEEEYWRGGALTQSSLHPAQVIYAEPIGENSILLVDESGNCAIYDYTTGRWTVLRNAGLGQKVHSRLPGAKKGMQLFLLSTDRQTTVVVTLANGQIAKEDEVAVPPETLWDFLEHVGWTPTELIRSDDERFRKSDAQKIVKKHLSKVSKDDFDPERVEGLWGRDTWGLLVEKSGAYVKYDRVATCAGWWSLICELLYDLCGWSKHDYQWTVLHKAVPGQEVYGWFSALKAEKAGQPQPFPRRNFWLLLKTEQQTTEVIPLADREVGEKDKISVPVPPETLWTFLQQVEKRPPSSIPRALLETETIKIVRENNQTEYHLKLDGVSRPLHPQPGGFSNDLAEEATFSRSGKLCVLRVGQWVYLMPIPGTAELRLTHYESKDDTCETNPTGSERTLATLDFAGYKLDWIRLPGGSIRAAWSDVQLPVWGVGGKLAIQSVQDIVLPNNNELLVATQGGLLVRDPTTYALKAMYPDLKDIRFVQRYSPKRLLIKVSNNVAFEWKDGQPVSSTSRSPSDLINSVESGPWSWQLQHVSAGQVALEVRHRTDNHHRGWTQTTSGQWKCNDDIITWIARGASDNAVWFATQDGLWPFDLSRGRSTELVDRMRGLKISKVLSPSSHSWWWQDTSQQWHQEQPSPGTLAPQQPPSEEFSFKNAVITVSYFDGQVTFRPSDGASSPVFKYGRFFFDNGEQIAGDKNSLYVFIPERGILRRNPANPVEITGFWQLPPTLQQVQYAFKLSPDGALQLEADIPGTSKRRIWRLDVSRSVIRWQEPKIVEEQNKAIFGPIVWQPQPGNKVGIEPFLVQKQNPHHKLQDWWSNDRFAWDKVTSIGALSGNIAILVTPIGLVVMQSSHDRFFKTVSIFPMQNMSYCAIAREGERPIGLAIGMSNKSPQYLITTNAQGKPSITEWSSGSPLLYKTIVSVGYTGPTYDRSIGLSQTWVPYTPSAAQSTSGALESRLPRFPATILLRDGQFIFDRADGASPTGITDSSGSKSNMWITFTECQGSNTSTCAIALNQLQHEAGTGRHRLILRGLWPSEVNLHALRPSPGGGFFGVYKITGTNKIAWKAKRGYITAQELIWNDASLHEIGKAFRVGDRVNIDVATLRWNFVEPFHIWDSVKPVTVTPQNYKLFISTAKGTTLPFDVITSLSMDKKYKNLAVGTQGGVFIYSGTKDGNSLLALSHPGRLLTFNNHHDPNDWVIEVERLRHDIHGNLWAKFGTNGRTAKLIAGTNWDLKVPKWSVAYGTVRDYTVNIDGLGFKAHGKLYERSNDAWGIGRKQLSNIVDFVFDDESSILWLATRKTGVFKVLPERLPR